MLVTLLGNLYGITLGFDVVAKLESLYESFHGINGGKINALLLRESLEYTDGKVIGSDEGIELGSMDGKVLGIILGNVNVTTLATYVVTKFVSLNGFFDGSNDKTLKANCLENHWHLLMEKFWDMMKASNWVILMVKCL